jgi:hypothetical protein
VGHSALGGRVDLRDLLLQEPDPWASSLVDLNQFTYRRDGPEDLVWRRSDTRLLYLRSSPYLPPTIRNRERAARVGEIPTHP